MTAVAWPQAPRLKLSGRTALSAAGGAWLAAALVGQWAFALYIVAMYGASTLTGHFEGWAKNSMLFRGYVPGDQVGNLTFGAHALAAGIVALGGALQLLPQVRSRFPTFHRWNGRVFLATVSALSLAGFYLVWVRGTGQDLIHNLAISGNGVLILGFAALALVTAMRRDIASHKRWALRLYMVSNAQWFMRVGFVAWFAVTFPMHLPKAATNGFFLAWTFGCYLVPLAVAELYIRAQAGGGPRAKLALAGGIGALTLLMLVGTAGFSFVSWRIVNGLPLGL